MFRVIQLIVVLVIFAVLATGMYYVTGLRADLAISQENSKKLEEGIKAQQEAMEALRADQAKIKDINNDLNTKIQLQNKDMDNLKDKFNTNAKGEKRDFGGTAVKNPGGIERAVNRGTENASRCLEIASGSPLTEREKAATKKSEINTECPALANPNYKP
jgi:hypothetical protein